jgi:hypothetical protein
MEIHEINDTEIITDAGAVNRNAFEKWVDDNNKRDWIHDTSNYRGEHEQSSGTMTWDDYYDNDKYVCEDLNDYIKYLQTVPSKIKTLPNLRDSLRKLVSNGIR